MPDRDDRLTTEDLSGSTHAGGDDRDDGLAERIRDEVRERTGIGADDPAPSDDATRHSDTGTRDDEPARHEEPAAGSRTAAAEPGTERQEARQADGAGAAPTEGTPAARTTPAEGTAAGTTPEQGAGGSQPLMPPADLEDFQSRWDTVQTRFVDEPRRAVEDADSLVAEAMRTLADTFASERANLEEQWDRGGEVDTEALRVTLQRYRSFFHRLLSA